MLQGVAGCCRVLQGVAGCCRVLQGVVTESNTRDMTHCLLAPSLALVFSESVLQGVLQGALQCVAVCCSVLQCVAVCYSVLQCVAPSVALVLTETCHKQHASRVT